MSCSLKKGSLILTLGMFTPLLFEITPSVITRQTMSVSSNIFSTQSSIKPSSIRTLSFGFNSLARFVYVTLQIVSSPITSRVVRVNCCSLFRWTELFAKVFIRISGPFVSSIIAIGKPNSSLTFFIRSIRISWSLCEPCEKLSLQTLRPALKSSFKIFSESDAGPIVQTILVFFMLTSPYGYNYFIFC